MTLQELEKYLSKGEGVRIEYKKASNKVPTSLYETVVSFLNKEGGVIILGAEDDGRVLGIEHDSIQTMMKNISSACNDTDNINPPISITPIEVEHPEGKVLVLKIHASSQVHTHAGVIYDRETDNDIRITDQERIGDIYLRKKNLFTETTIYPALEYGDLDLDLFDKARSIIRSTGAAHPYLEMSNEEILKSSSLYFKDFRTGDEGLTLAAALIFGKDSTIQNLLPGYKIEAMVRRDNLDRWDDRITLRTNLIDSYLDLMSFFRKHLPDKFFLENDQRKDLREIIFREVVGNILVHREYTSSIDTSIVIYKNKVMVKNPAKAYFRGPLDPHNFSPYPKNPNIRKFFTVFAWTDEIGSGLRNITKYLKEYVPKAIPIFLEDDVFQTKLPLESFVFYDFIENWKRLFDWDQPELIEHLSLGLKTVTLNNEWSELNFDGLLLELVPSWHQNGTRLEGLDWSQKQIFKKEDIKKVPSWVQNGTKLFHRKTNYLLRILMLCSSPIPMDTLMNYMEYSNRATFRNNYMKPLMKEGLINYTIPEKPSDPKQQYQLTEKGKLFLGGYEVSNLVPGLS